MFPEILIIILLFAILLAMIISQFRGSRHREDAEFDFSEGTEENSTPCPLCEKALHRGERVHSVVYSQGEDRLMNIYGCPWCYPAHPAGFKKPNPPRERRCPSCGGPLKEGSFAIARVFERPGRKVHVHVLGCPSCRRRDGA